MKSLIKLIFLFCAAILFLGNCKPMDFQHTRFLSGEYGLLQLERLSDRVPESCDLYPSKVEVPSPIVYHPEYKNYTHFAYCIPFKIDLQEKVDWGLFLGFIDNEHRIYLNGKLISSTELEEKRGNTLFYEKAIILHIGEMIFQEENTLIVKVKKYNFESFDGGGIYAGLIKLDDYDRIRTENHISKAYGLAKSVLFFSTSILFFILFLSRTSNKEYLWFGIFLVNIGIYAFCRLELKHDLGIDLYVLKYIEYLALTLILPVFALFLFAILYKSKLHVIPLGILFGGILFLLIFLVLGNLLRVEIFNLKYHIPYLLFTSIVLFLVMIHEIYKKNPRAFPVFVICFIPFAMTFFDILNMRYKLLPAFSNIQVSGDSILILVASMTFYASYSYYSIQKKLDNTMHKEEMLRKTFQLYVPPKDIEKILSNYNQKEELLNLGELEEKIILFCDIRNFTDLSEKLNPNQTVNFLNSYFKTFNRIIIENGGVIDKLIGDCIMARFDTGKEGDALKCALEMISGLVPYNRARRKLSPAPISHGIGISSGKVIVGNIGSINKMDYTVIGDTVNIASRLESLTKFYKVSILVTERIQLKLRDKVLFREIDTIQIKGKKKITRIFEPLDIIS